MVKKVTLVKCFDQKVIHSLMLWAFSQNNHPPWLKCGHFNQVGPFEK
jgi:hypothetical protein